ncbi:fatty acid-binding protein 2-like [Danaus plexippus]|uniref:Fatty acid binding protein 2 n=1 Tax=Danaus plexippus plexippus TaxID=278856 RepID=A0A212FN63_DANPL|nr:fatty acid-binding protein 2-like [Danaus plexippus]OWR55130.1 fatty acid binding protein 2 [Danaus plexippus plexippus]
MEFLGKTYIRVRDENYKEFLESFGLSDERVKSFISLNQTQSLQKDGDGYVLIYDKPDGQTVIKFKNGVEFEEEVNPNSISKTTLTLDGNVLTHIQNLGTVIINIKREFSADQLVMTITTNLWDGTARRYFKRM